MNKFSIYVPFDGNYANVLADFTEQKNVKYLFNIEDMISNKTLPSDAEDALILEVALAQAAIFAPEVDMRFTLTEGDIYEFTDATGNQIGWEVDYMTYEF